MVSDFARDTFFRRLSAPLHGCDERRGEEIENYIYLLEESYRCFILYALNSPLIVRV
jgi:hypothetical protein